MLGHSCHVGGRKKKIFNRPPVIVHCRNVIRVPRDRLQTTYMAVSFAVLKRCNDEIRIFLI